MLAYNKTDLFLFYFIFLVQRTLVAPNHVRIEVSVRKWAPTRMNVTVHGLDITVKTAQHVSEKLHKHIEEVSMPVSALVPNFLICFLFTAEFLTWVKVSLKPSPNTVHYILTHFKSLWNIINNVSFLRNGIMRYVLTCKYKAVTLFLSETLNNFK